VYAGSGKNYGAARAPRYLMTDKGRVAFVAAATSTIPTAPPGKGRSNVFAPMRALPADGEMPGRPGGSMIAVTPIFVVPKSLANSLEAVKKGFPTGGGLYAPQNDTAERFQILEQNFRYADTERARYTYEVNKSDVDAILHAVKEGKQKSDFLSFGLDSPDVTYLEKPDTDPTPADFLQGLAHQVIDAGADTFVGTGVHVLRGIEIYKGRPIFYGLGAFLRQIDIARVDVSFPERGTIDSDPTKYESVIAVNRYAGGRLSEVRLYPLQLGEDKRMAERGLPRVATPEAAQRILKRLQEVSAPFSTQIVIENNIGIIRVSKSN
jgi:poly-gamma-glutamate capsule biosynthesis protein CapA/YwtB (metallophosphatase superfamily)